MKTLIIIFSIFLINIFGCDKNASSDSNDINIITQNWKVVSIILNNNQNQYEIENGDYLKQDAYVLYFNSDSTFILNTSVNSIEGELYISFRTMELSFYNISGTRVGQPDNTIRELDSILIEVFKSINSYLIVNDNVEFIGNKGNINLNKFD